MVGHVSKEFVHFGNELIELRQVLKQPLWNQDAAVVIALLAPFANGVANARDDVLKRFFAVVALFRHDHHVGTGLQRAL